MLARRRAVPVAALLALPIVVLPATSAETRAGTLVFDHTFPAAVNDQWYFSFAAPTNGQFLVRMSNPDRSADGMVTIVNKTNATGTEPELHYGANLAFGTYGDPILPRQQITQGLGENWYALPSLASWGTSTYLVHYHDEHGTQNSGQNRLEIMYRSEPLSTAGLTQLVSLHSEAQQANSIGQ
jgi:hypothetical protein